MEAGNCDIAEDLQASNFLQSASATSYLRQVCNAKVSFQLSMALRYLEEEAFHVFRVTHIWDGLPQPTFPEDAVLLLMGAKRNVTSPNKRKVEFALRPF